MPITECKDIPLFKDFSEYIDLLQEYVPYGDLEKDKGMNYELSVGQKLLDDGYADEMSEQVMATQRKTLTASGKDSLEDNDAKALFTDLETAMKLRNGLKMFRSRTSKDWYKNTGRAKNYERLTT